jgi:hypothetical protein
VTVRGETLVVTFVERGLPPGAMADIQVEATRTTRVRCADRRAPGEVVLDTSSTASATETGTYAADARGSVEGTRDLHAAPGKVEITGYDCATEDRVVVTLRDLTTGAALTLAP